MQVYLLVIFMVLILIRVSVLGPVMRLFMDLKISDWVGQWVSQSAGHGVGQGGSHGVSHLQSSLWSNVSRVWGVQKSWVIWKSGGYRAPRIDRQLKKTLENLECCRMKRRSAQMSPTGIRDQGNHIALCASQLNAADLKDNWKSFRFYYNNIADIEIASLGPWWILFLFLQTNKVEFGIFWPIRNSISNLQTPI